MGRAKCFRPDPQIDQIRSQHLFSGTKGLIEGSYINCSTLPEDVRLTKKEGNTAFKRISSVILQKSINNPLE